MAQQSACRSRLLDFDPDLAEDLSDQEQRLARRRVVAELFHYPPDARTSAG